MGSVRLTDRLPVLGRHWPIWYYAMFARCLLSIPLVGDERMYHAYTIRQHQQKAIFETMNILPRAPKSTGQ